MRVDLDELERLDYANCKACVCMGGCSELLEAIPDLIAELRASRRLIGTGKLVAQAWIDGQDSRPNAAVLRQDWYEDRKAYDAATKGDG